MRRRQHGRALRQQRRRLGRTRRRRRVQGMKRAGQAASSRLVGSSADPTNLSVTSLLRAIRMELTEHDVFNRLFSAPLPESMDMGPWKQSVLRAIEEFKRILGQDNAFKLYIAGAQCCQKSKDILVGYSVCHHCRSLVPIPSTYEKEFMGQGHRTVLSHNLTPHSSSSDSVPRSPT